MFDNQTTSKLGPLEVAHKNFNDAKKSTFVENLLGIIFVSLFQMCLKNTQIIILIKVQLFLSGLFKNYNNHRSTIKHKTGMTK